ncbi:family 43 glycosylhydrolase [Flavobacterium chungbukense]
MLKINLKDFLQLFFLLCCFSIMAQNKNGKENKHTAPKPLYRDPVYDGAADPVIIWNKKEKLWYMFYTNRRANDSDAKGITWVHGTKIGIAVSKDGAEWTYKDTCSINYKLKDITYWAPEVIEYQNKYHMYLTVVPGIFNDWYHPRSIIHLTSSNLMDWKFESELKLASDRCIDASVFRLPNGTWRMFYNNENDGKSIYYADSNDLYNWNDSGTKVIKDRGEGPKVFVWKEKNWMITDSWRGLSVYSSEDFLNWNHQEKNILQLPGKGQDDKVIGGHADVVVNGAKAYVFYFTHPGRTPENKGVDNYETKRSSIQVAELEYTNGEISCNRDKLVQIKLKQ